MNINELDNKDKPRERLIEYGPEVLHDYELLAIMLSSGIKGMDVIELSHKLIKDYGLKRLFSMSYSELAEIPGIKSAKACKILASFEIAKRCIDKKSKIESLNKSKDFFHYIKNEFLYCDTEKLIVVLTDSKLRPIHKVSYSSSNPASVEFPIKKIVKEALIWNAYGLFLAHNHPGGSCKPSRSDYDETIEIMKILDSVNVKLHDHIIVYNDIYFSFHENKLID